MEVMKHYEATYIMKPMEGKRCVFCAAVWGVCAVLRDAKCVCACSSASVLIVAVLFVRV